jgi:hypothetical protein
MNFSCALIRNTMKYKKDYIISGNLHAQQTKMSQKIKRSRTNDRNDDGMLPLRANHPRWKANHRNAVGDTIMMKIFLRLVF